MWLVVEVYVYGGNGIRIHGLVTDLYVEIVGVAILVLKFAMDFYPKILYRGVYIVCEINKMVLLHCVSYLLLDFFLVWNCKKYFNLEKEREKVEGWWEANEHNLLVMCGYRWCSYDFSSGGELAFLGGGGGHKFSFVRLVDIKHDFCWGMCLPAPPPPPPQYGGCKV